MAYDDRRRPQKRGQRKETEAGVTMKLKRGTFSATFFFGLPCGLGIGRGSVRGDLAGVALPKIPERHLVIGGLFFFAFWLLVALPLLYTVPRYSHDEAAKKCSAEESKNHGFWEKASCDPTAYFTLWLVAFTGVLAVSTIGLWVVTARGVRTQTADTRILQRAYLSVEPAGISESITPTMCHININIRNAGNLPARRVRWNTDWLTSQNDRLRDFPINLDRLEGSVTLPPKAVMRQGGRRISIGDKPDELRKEVGWFLYAWGAVEYDDGFGVTRVTRFCHRYNTADLVEITGQKVDSSNSLATYTTGYSIDAIHARINRYGNDAT